MQTILASLRNRLTLKPTLIAGAVGVLYATTTVSPFADSGVVATAAAAEPSSALSSTALEEGKPEDAPAHDYCFGA